MKKIIFVCAFIFINFLSMAQLKVVSSGKVGINSTNPQCRLSISSDGNTYSSAYIYNPSTFASSRALQTFQKVTSSGNSWCYGLVSSIEAGSSSNNSKLVGIYSYTYRGEGVFTNDRTYGISAYAGNGANGFNYAVRAQLQGTRNGAAVFALVSDDDEVVDGRWAGYFD
jgi:hypothetical protein